MILTFNLLKESDHKIFNHEEADRVTKLQDCSWMMMMIISWAHIIRSCVSYHVNCTASTLHFINSTRAFARR